MRVSSHTLEDLSCGICIMLHIWNRHSVQFQGVQSINKNPPLPSVHLHFIFFLFSREMNILVFRSCQALALRRSHFDREYNSSLRKPITKRITCWSKYRKR